MPSRPISPDAPARRTSETDGPERLQKILAAAGLGSRRQCEDLILSGRVEVDRRVQVELGTKANAREQEIRVDGVPLPSPRLVYFLVNKPPGVVSTNSDPSGRPRVVDLVAYEGRLFTVGRLDMSSEGLILVTNDGELANGLTHPRYGIEKTYQVEVAGSLERRQLEKLRHGVHLAEGFARVVSVKVVRQYKQSTLLEIVLNEGRNREIRRVLARVGHKVERLKRVAIGPLRMADLPLGHVRALERDEVRRLKQAVRGIESQAQRTASRPVARATPKPARPARSVIGGGQAEKAGKRSTAKPARGPRCAGEATPRAKSRGTRSAARVRP
jgi:23S rRNA pseudouridine2605 synthase